MANAIASPTADQNLSGLAGQSPVRALVIEAESFCRQFNRQPFLLPHQLSGDPLFALPRLIELARRLPEEYVEYNAGKLPVSIDSRLTPRNGLSIEDTIRRIEDHCSWMVLKRVEQDPAYQRLLHRILDEVQVFSERLDPGMFDRAGAIFISSPGSVTPYHLDAEYNFLLQIRGHKTVYVFDPADRTILSEQELEMHATKGDVHRNLVFQEAYQQKAVRFDLTPGFALHVPSMAPHWVQNGEQVSISFSAGFVTRSQERRESLYRVNRFLRKLGLRPAPVGQSAVRDLLKYQGFRAWRKVTSGFTQRSRAATSGAGEYARA